MSDADAWTGFRKEIGDALDLLSDVPRPTPDMRSLSPAGALPSLLEQCRDLIGQAGDSAPPMLRSVHHLACTGGTLISRCIAAMPNTQVLSEVDPLSPMAHKQPFHPTDLIGLVKSGSRPSEQSVLIRIFLAGLDALYRETHPIGVRLVLRDHAHGQFCVDDRVADRPTLGDILLREYTLCSLVTVRHPLDSYLSLLKRGWVHFSPGDIESYAQRYLAFLDRYEGVEILRYEDFVRDPEGRMQHICKVLSLSYNPAFEQIIPALHLSGDSGRSGTVISPRPRRPVPEDLTADLGASLSYAALCRRLGYDPA